MREGPKAITALAFDFGTRRIGLAVGNSITGSSQALTAITADNDDVRQTQSMICITFADVDFGH